MCIGIDNLWGTFLFLRGTAQKQFNCIGSGLKRNCCGETCEIAKLKGANVVKLSEKIIYGGYQILFKN